LSIAPVTYVHNHTWKKISELHICLALHRNPRTGMIQILILVPDISTYSSPLASSRKILQVSTWLLRSEATCPQIHHWTLWKSACGCSPKAEKVYNEKLVGDFVLMLPLLPWNVSTCTCYTMLCVLPSVVLSWNFSCALEIFFLLKLFWIWTSKGWTAVYHSRKPTWFDYIIFICLHMSWYVIDFPLSQHLLHSALFSASVYALFCCVSKRWWNIRQRLRFTWKAPRIHRCCGEK